MVENYIATKIAEALQASKGDRHEACKTVLAWATRDHALLLGLTKPHLRGLAAAAVEKYGKDVGKSTAAFQTPKTTAAHAPRSAAGGVTTGKSNGVFSKKDVAAMLTGSGRGDRRAFPPAPLPKAKSSARHASVIQELVAAFIKKK